MLDDSIGSSPSSPTPAAPGIGLRFPHHRQLLDTTPSVSWFEVHSENFFGGGTVRQTLLSVRRNYPLSLHGVGISLGVAKGSMNAICSALPICCRSRRTSTSTRCWLII